MRFIAHTTNPLDGDSVAGVLSAIKAGFAGADVNVHSTADGVIVALHWAAGGGWPLYPRADALTFAQCQARRNRKRTSARIPNITELLDAAEKADPGFVLCLEAKPSPGLEDPKVWRQVAGRNAIAMVIQRFRTATWEKAAIRRMAAAKAAGVPTMLLWRHHIPADSPWWGVIDAVKGAPLSQAIPSHVIRIPLGGMRPEKAREILHSVLAKGAGVPGPRPPKPDPRPPAPEEPVMPALDDRYERTTRDGRSVDRWTAQALDAAQEKCGLTLTVTQGSWSTSVGASAGTHAGGGVVDLKPTTNPTKAVKALRECGFAAWHRKPGQGPWPSHIHAVLINNTQAAASAKRQVVAYEGGLNGLANGGPDDGPKVPVQVFPYRGIPQRRSDMNAVEYGRYLIKAGLDQLAKTDKPRPAVAAAAKAITKALKDMPSK